MACRFHTAEKRVVAVVLRDQFSQTGRHLVGQRLRPPRLDVHEYPPRRRDAFLLVGVPEIAREGPARRADAQAARFHVDSVHGIVQRFMAPVEGDSVLSQHKLVAAPQLRKAVDVFSEHGGSTVGQRERARGPVPRC